jgi:hypothetical protein
MTRIITNFMRAWANSCELVNGTEGISDIEGKAATGSGERAGMRASFKLVSGRNLSQIFVQYLSEGTVAR